MNKKSGFIAATLVIALLVFSVCMFISSLTKLSKQMKDETIEFYSPMHINDSIVHLNVTENSCVTFYIQKDTLLIHSKNIEYIDLDKETHIVTIFTHDKNKDHVLKELCLDTILQIQNIYSFKIKNQ